ncbi:PAAR domain-containing protein [Pseudomonas asiatica]|uniref:PAAR domain-containing protein n=1 Tax=Pseudomonas TaxID=286 RepID=UPI00209BB98A|nr:MULTISPECIES: PAAR domain-containing protein [Pseudomonas]MCO7525599.1 PAAR domain-containing protein [Pseudomonas asiatica]MDH4430631.1 PAAR domain-containing protein [Pseudomonas shirazica]
MSAAARYDDPIQHSSALGGLLAGLALGAGAVLVGIAVVATGGLGGIAIAAMVGAGAATGAGIGQLLGGLSFAKRETGRIISGSSNVHVNGKPAARAHLDYAKCSEHSGTPKILAQGSHTVYINGVPAARVGDVTACDGKISVGSPNVEIGGETETTDEISPEVPGWLEGAVLGIGLASAVVLVGPAMALWGMFGGVVGGAVGYRLGGDLWGEGSNGQKLLAFGGAFAVGGLAARYRLQPNGGLGSNFGNVNVVKRTPSPLSRSVATPNSAIEKVSTHKVPYSPVTKSQRAVLKSKMDQRTMTKEEYKRLDWDRRFANKRAKGVSRFWADERARLKMGEPGTRSWTAQQRADILANKTPKFNGEPIQGHHKYNALDHPQLASDPKNIYPATRTEHFERWHGGNWRNDSFGKPVNLNYPEEF